MGTYKVTESDRSMLLDALYARVALYEGDAETCRAAGLLRIADQFERQREQAIALAERLENGIAVFIELDGAGEARRLPHA